MTYETLERSGLTYEQIDYVLEFGDKPSAILLSQLALFSESNINPSLIVASEIMLDTLLLKSPIKDRLSLSERAYGIVDFNQINMCDWLEVFEDFIPIQCRFEEIWEEIDMNESLSNEQERILNNLALIISRQIEREDHLCPFAEEMGYKLLRYRPEYLSKTVIYSLEFDSMVMGKHEGFPPVTKLGETLLKETALVFQLESLIEDLILKENPKMHYIYYISALALLSTILSEVTDKNSGYLFGCFLLLSALITYISTGNSRKAIRNHQTEIEYHISEIERLREIAHT